MSSIEERLARDIAEVSRGVVVTDSDLRDARTAIDDRIGSGRQQDRRRSAFAAAAAAAVVVLLLGLAAYLTIGGEDKAAPPAGPGPSPSPSIDNHAHVPHRQRPNVRAHRGRLAAGQRRPADALRAARPGLLGPRRPALRGAECPGQVRDRRRPDQRSPWTAVRPAAAVSRSPCGARSRSRERCTSSTPGRGPEHATPWSTSGG